MFIDPPYFDLIDCGIALYGRFVAVQLRGEIEAGFA
jgi:hypothetical protein